VYPQKNNQLKTYFHALPVMLLHRRCPNRIILHRLYYIHSNLQANYPPFVQAEVYKPKNKQFIPLFIQLPQFVFAQ